MINCALLIQPGFGKADAEAARQLCLIEFAAMSRLLSQPVEETEYSAIGGVPAVVFRSAGPLSDADGALLRRLSFFYGLFEVSDANDRRALFPVELPDSRYFPDHLGSMLKYAGKTNERFTRMMINLALSSCQTGNKGVIRLLDPMCGKGTTLFEALVDGMDVSGTEIMRSYWQETQNYLVKFLERGRYKHRASSETVPDNKGRKLGDVFLLTMANSKADFDAGIVRTLRLVHGDSKHTGLFFKRASHDMLVCDLPYNVQHEGRSSSGHEDLAKLLDRCLPGWVALMKPGGSAVLSFNEHTLKRTAVEEALECHGLQVLREEPFCGCPHRVDQGIKRDFVVAVKP